LHAAWDNSAPNEKDKEGRDVEARKRREKGLDVIARVLDLRERERVDHLGETDTISDAALSGKQAVDYTGFQHETKDALGRFTDAVVENYVKLWYGPILPKDSSFPSACRHTLTRFFLAVSNQPARKRPADTFLDFLTNSSSIVIVFLSELSSALKEVLGQTVLKRCINSYSRIQKAALQTFSFKNNKTRSSRAYRMTCFRAFWMSRLTNVDP